MNMRMNHLAHAAVIAALSVSSGIAAASCEVPGQAHVVLCPSPALLASAWPLAASWNWANGSPDPASVMGCGRIYGKIPKARITQERTWHTKGGETVMAYLDLGVTATVQHDAYSAEGEYLGKRTESITGGWVLKREIVCDASSNRADGDANATPKTSAVLGVTLAEHGQRANQLLEGLQSPLRVTYVANQFGGTASLTEHLQLFGSVDKTTGKMTGMMLVTDASDEQGKANFLAAITAITGAALPGQSRQETGAEVTALIQSYKGPVGSVVTRTSHGAKLSFGTGKDGNPWFAIDAL